MPITVENDNEINIREIVGRRSHQRTCQQQSEEPGAELLVHTLGCSFDCIPVAWANVSGVGQGLLFRSQAPSR
jgi:hypothetical protein